MPAAWSDAEAIAAGLYDPPGSSGANSLKAQTDKLKTGASDLFGGNLAPIDVTAASGKTDPLANSKFNGWMNYFTSKATGLPSGNNGTANPGAMDSPSSKAVVTAVSSVDWGHWLARGAVILLGFIFVAVGLAMFGINNPVADVVLKKK